MGRARDILPRPWVGVPLDRVLGRETVLEHGVQPHLVAHFLDAAFGRRLEDGVADAAGQSAGPTGEKRGVQFHRHAVADFRRFCRAGSDHEVFAVNVLGKCHIHCLVEGVNPLRVVARKPVLANRQFGRKHERAQLIRAPGEACLVAGIELSDLIDGLCEFPDDRLVELLGIERVLVALDGTQCAVGIASAQALERIRVAGVHHDFHERRVCIRLYPEVVFVRIVDRRANVYSALDQIRVRSGAGVASPRPAGLLADDVRVRAFGKHPVQPSDDVTRLERAEVLRSALADLAALAAHPAEKPRAERAYRPAERLDPAQNRRTDRARQREFVAFGVEDEVVQRLIAASGEMRDFAAGLRLRLHACGFRLVARSRHRLDLETAGDTEHDRYRPPGPRRLDRADDADARTGADSRRQRLRKSKPDKRPDADSELDIALAALLGDRPDDVANRGGSCVRLLKSADLVVRPVRQFQRRAHMVEKLCGLGQCIRHGRGFNLL